MITKEEEKAVYMGTALLWAKRSNGIRAKVGAVLVTANRVTLTGYNGTPPGDSNVLESHDPDTGELITKKSVIHAELNCILKAAREGVSCVGSSVFLTLSPCLQCSAMLVSAGVVEVFYKEAYHDRSGIDYLKQMGVNCEQLNV